MNKQKVITAKIIDSIADLLIGFNNQLAANPELGFEEFQAVKWITKILRDNEFKVEQGIAGLETAFRAEYKFPVEGPTIAILAEYDALPKIGHGCGHNFIAAASLGAVLGLKKTTGLNGRIVCFGCPGEENGGGKVSIVNKDFFSDVDIAMLVHPANKNMVYSTSNAIDALEFCFKGRSAHAASSPEKGINALSALIQFFNGINAFRASLQDNVSIHGIIIEGGRAANIIPDKAVARFYIRAEERDYLNEIVEKIKVIAQSSAMMIGAEVNWHNYELSNDNLQPNRRLADIFEENYKILGVEPIAPAVKSKGSTDMGNVSRVVPAIHPYIAIGSENEITAHTREFAQATTSQRAYDALLKAAKALAFTAIDVLLNKNLLQEIKEEFKLSHL